MTKKIHVISFQVPYPPNYGGVIDIYYKLESLKKENYYIILHTYIYNREKHENELKQVADEIYFYKRNTNLITQLSILPYIINSRKNKDLLKNLLKDKAPILFEGLHTCYLLNHPRLKERLKIVRTHNIEHEYYFSLQQATSCIWKKIFYSIEAIRLKHFEKKINSANYIISITEKDQLYFQDKYPQVTSHLIPCFFKQEIRENVREKENYILYQGNLAVEENIKAVMYLLKEVCPYLPNSKLIIAGSNPNSEIINLIKTLKQVELIENPPQKTMEKLISNAQINILITFQSTGIKLKLLNALYMGGFCIVNTPMIEGTGLDKTCRVADSPKEMINLIQNTQTEIYTNKEKLIREELLENLYSNKKNIQILTNIYESETKRKRGEFTEYP